jgi:hypothetical protein
MSDFGFNKQESNRTEKFEIKMDLKGETVKKHLDSLRKICRSRVFEGNDVHFNYKFFAEYFGNVAEKLAIVHSFIKDPEVIITSAECKTLEAGNCLVYEVFKSLEKIIKTLKGREDESN